jgi:1,2-phenylacetyl-CoA epoxidase PaaB subunit
MDEWNATPPAHGVFFECLRIALYAAQRRLVAEKATHQFHRARNYFTRGSAPALRHFWVVKPINISTKCSLADARNQLTGSDGHAPEISHKRGGPTSRGGALNRATLIRALRHGSKRASPCEKGQPNSRDRTALTHHFRDAPDEPTTGFLVPTAVAMQLRSPPNFSAAPMWR